MGKIIYPPLPGSPDQDTETAIKQDKQREDLHGVGHQLPPPTPTPTPHPPACRPAAPCSQHKQLLGPHTSCFLVTADQVVARTAEYELLAAEYEQLAAEYEQPAAQYEQLAAHTNGAPTWGSV
jgi:hypothetical protein